MCKKCDAMEHEHKSFYCMDCGNDISIWGIAEWFMVSNSVWERSGAGKEDDLCVGCLEKRIGRKLTSYDFGGTGSFPVNSLFEQSPRLRDRMGKRLETEMTVGGLITDLLRSYQVLSLKKRIEDCVDRHPPIFGKVDGYI